MLPNSYLTELDCDARRADYLREAWNDAVAGEARHARPSRLIATLVALAAVLGSRRTSAPAWTPAPAASNDRAGLQAA